MIGWPRLELDDVAANGRRGSKKKMGILVPAPFPFCFLLAPGSFQSIGLGRGAFPKHLDGDSWRAERRPAGEETEGTDRKKKKKYSSCWGSRCWRDTQANGSTYVAACQHGTILAKTFCSVAFRVRQLSLLPFCGQPRVTTINQGSALNARQ